MKKTILSQNLLNRVEPESTRNRYLWTYFHDGKWYVTDDTPVIAGRDAYGRYHVDVNVKEVFDDAESMLKAQRQNGFHSWK